MDCLIISGKVALDWNGCQALILHFAVKSANWRYIRKRRGFGAKDAQALNIALFCLYPEQIGQGPICRFCF